jgi:PEGA domain
MRKTTCLLALVLSAGVVGLAQTPAKSSTAAASKLSQAMLVDGTPVKLRVGAGINTASVRVGDELELDVDQEVRINDVVVISTSSVAKVVVTSQGLDAAKTGNAMVGLRYVTLADGEKVALRPTAERKPNAAKTMLVSAGEGDVAIGNGAEVTAYVNGNLPLDLPKLRLANQPTNELKITTTPGNAEVSVDGKVMGSTPFSARVVHGEHVVALRMAGFQAWRETVRVTAEPTTLQIALKKQDGMESVPQVKNAPASLGDLARAARAKKAAEDGPKSAGEPIELLPGEERSAPPPAGTPQSPMPEPESSASPTPASTTPAASTASPAAPAPAQAPATPTTAAPAATPTPASTQTPQGSASQPAAPRN